MSERLIADMAACAVKACAALAGIATSVGHSAYNTLLWLSEEQQREMERLENTLTVPTPTHMTTKEAIQTFQENLRSHKSDPGFAIGRVWWTSVLQASFWVRVSSLPCLRLRRCRMRFLACC